MKLGQYNYNQAKHFSKGRRGNEPTIILLHYTAGSGDAQRTSNFFAKGNVKASAHFCMSRDGEVIQCVDLDDVAWHAGESSFRGEEGLVNKKSIGIEICNTGWDCEKIDDSKIFKGRHRNPASQKKEWESFDERQYVAIEKLCRELKAAYPSLKFMTFHEDVRNSDVIDISGSKTDPGPAFNSSKINWDSLGIEEWHWSFKRKIWYSGNPTD